MDQIFSGLYIEEEKLAAFAANSARLLETEGEGSAAAAAAELRCHLAAVRRCRDAVAARYADADAVPSACEWLLDNWYLAQREAAAAIADLRAARRQRRGKEGLLMLSLCRTLLSSGRGWLDAGRCAAFLRGFQTVTPLRRRELLLFPAAMRAAILEAMAAVCDTLPYAADSAPQREAFEALFSSLRHLAGADMEALLRSVDLCDEAFREDPGNVYARMDRESRRSYLERLEMLARAEGTEEHLLACRLVQKAREEGRHLGFFLYDEPADAGSGLYIAAVVLTSLFLSLLLAFAAGSAWAAPLLLLPVSELVKGLVDLALLRLIPPRRLPRMDLTEGVPPEGKTLCVLSALLTDAACAERLCQRLEEFRLSHRKAGPNLQYGVLADLPAADEAETEKDAAVLRAAREAIAALNRRYGGGFYLFTRPRRFDGERWSGAERKRGALLELARLIADEPSALSVTGERDALAGTRYILTLDSDTRMQPGAALSLIGAMLHPMNRAHIDPEKRVMTAGYGLIHPRLTTELSSANATDFALIFAGPGGSDPYGSLCGELYMDAFDCGGFAGKGILDVRALLTCTAERIPPQTVLSHDALEGAFLRGGYLGDACIADGFPARPLSYYKRLHRWVRGDWQNSPWLFNRQPAPEPPCPDDPAGDPGGLFPALFRAAAVGLGGAAGAAGRPAGKPGGGCSQALPRAAPAALCAAAHRCGRCDRAKPHAPVAAALGGLGLPLRRRHRPLAHAGLPQKDAGMGDRRPGRAEQRRSRRDAARHGRAGGAGARLPAVLALGDRPLGGASVAAVPGGAGRARPARLPHRDAQPGRPGLAFLLRGRHLALFFRILHRGGSFSPAGQRPASAAEGPRPPHVAHQHGPRRRGRRLGL